ncbi:DUF222 domain-containing protein [Mycobacterium tuberculosis]|uniref:DUF222 domain-containing protein n=1 Tax=Mycobacterium tuberculosis TaxID=1773 RepID=UPI0032B5EF8B
MGHHGGGGRRGGGGVAGSVRVWRQPAAVCAWAMCERLPKTAEVFSAGDIGYLMFATIVYRTDFRSLTPMFWRRCDSGLAANAALAPR